MCTNQNLTWLVDLFIIGTASVHLRVVTDTIVLVSAMQWAHYSTQYAYTSQCAWFNLKQVKKTLFVSLHHVTLLLTDMWQQPHANPRPGWSHMIAHTRPVYNKWTTWITDLIPSSVNHIECQTIFPMYLSASLYHFPSMTTAGANATLMNGRETFLTKVTGEKRNTFIPLGNLEPAFLLTCLWNSRGS